MYRTHEKCTCKEAQKADAKMLKQLVSTSSIDEIEDEKIPREDGKADFGLELES